MHKHIIVSRDEARALASHPQLDIDFCRCLAFRLAGCERWVEARSFTRKAENTFAENGPQVKKHRHKVVARSSAAALGTHGSIWFEDCSCGAFRLRSVSKWIEPTRPDEALTIAQACQFLHCGYDVVYRLLWKGLVHGEKRPIAGSRKQGWYISVA